MIDSLLKPFQRFGVHLGLERIQRLLGNLGNPHHQVPVVHVAGTNGKGSVCAYLSSVLTEAGYRTGRYISPHLVDWTERICLNEQQISSDKLRELILEVQAAINTNEESPTQFEVITAAAWLYFAQQKVDIAVIEVGLGGRLDATNICENPLVTVITSISREHWQQLGPTVADIAREKAGIIKPGCPAVIGPLPPEAEKVVWERIQELQCPAITPKSACEISPGWAEYTSHFPHPPLSPSPPHPLPTSHSPLPTLKYPLPLAGQIQLMNSATSIATLEILKNAGWEKITEEAIVNGMAKTKWPGRMQWVSWKERKLLIDGAHNPAAAKVLRNYVDTLVQTPSPRSVNWVMGMLSTKDHADVFKFLLRPLDKLYLVPVSDHSSAKPEELAKLAQEICPGLSYCNTYTDLSLALEAAFDSTDNLVVLCGSLYLVGSFLGSGE
ncbi:MAG: bifunctional folylpolyglutamate synthase/dihydrofolate synthase [Scytonematopsis contorta HA4267-MV1]|jgi:dihydrofolate synthase/folylpolyglutamate synthase|nr:bifunctional folylpolyglutamate synthase/dihydrofolate synthase [Scytonematopsis contorta HA4267-MV1]